VTRAGYDVGATMRLKSRLQGHEVRLRGLLAGIDAAGERIPPPRMDGAADVFWGQLFTTGERMESLLTSRP